MLIHYSKNRSLTSMTRHAKTSVPQLPHNWC